MPNPAEREQAHLLSTGKMCVLGSWAVALPLLKVLVVKLQFVCLNKLSQTEGPGGPSLVRVCSALRRREGRRSAVVSLLLSTQHCTSTELIASEEKYPQRSFSTRTRKFKPQAKRTCPFFFCALSHGKLSHLVEPSSPPPPPRSPATKKPLRLSASATRRLRSVGILNRHEALPGVATALIRCRKVRKKTCWDAQGFAPGTCNLQSDTQLTRPDCEASL